MPNRPGTQIRVRRSRPCRLRSTSQRRRLCRGISDFTVGRQRSHVRRKPSLGRVVLSSPSLVPYASLGLAIVLRKQTWHPHPHCGAERSVAGALSGSPFRRCSDSVMLRLHPSLAFGATDLGIAAGPPRLVRPGFGPVSHLLKTPDNTCRRQIFSPYFSSYLGIAWPPYTYPDGLGRDRVHRADNQAGSYIAQVFQAILCGAPGGIRTPDPLLRRQPLSPLSYGRAPWSW